MKNQIFKIMIMVFMIATVIIPTGLVKAATVNVGTDQELRDAITAGNSVVLTSDITVTEPMTISETTNVTGGGFKIIGSGVSNIFTVAAGKRLVMRLVTIEGATGYGVVVIDGAEFNPENAVFIENNTTGAIYLNGGRLIIGQLTLAGNGKGIVIDKDGVSTDPSIFLAGTLNATPAETAIYGTPVGSFSINLDEDKAASQQIDKDTVNGNFIVIKDRATGAVLYRSNNLLNCTFNTPLIECDSYDPANPDNPNVCPCDPNDPATFDKDNPNNCSQPKNPDTGDETRAFLGLGVVITIISLFTIGTTRKKAHQR